MSDPKITNERNTMTTTTSIPTPPAWIDVDSVIPRHLRERAFTLADALRSAEGDTLTIAQLNEARNALQTLDVVETPALKEVNTDGCENSCDTHDGILDILSEYGGSMALHNAMVGYVDRCTNIAVDKYHPDEFMRPSAQLED